jgi:hypothetical protein
MPSIKHYTEYQDILGFLQKLNPVWVSSFGTRSSGHNFRRRTYHTSTQLFRFNLTHPSGQGAR